jgi:hypothetical protein
LMVPEFCGGTGVLWWYWSFVMVLEFCDGTGVLWWYRSFVMVPEFCDGTGALWFLVSKFLSCAVYKLLDELV